MRPVCVRLTDRPVGVLAGQGWTETDFMGRSSTRRFAKAKPPEPTCPFEPGGFCPLLVAAHDPVAIALSCVDDRIEDGGCAVDRGLDYSGAVAALRAAHPRLVAECEMLEEARQREAQRKRNMRAAGLQ